MAALIPPTQARPLTSISPAGMKDNILMKPMWAMTTNSGMMSHVQKLKDISTTAAKDSRRAVIPIQPGYQQTYSEGHHVAHEVVANAVDGIAFGIVPA